MNSPNHANELSPVLLAVSTRCGCADVGVAVIAGSLDGDGSAGVGSATALGDGRGGGDGVAEVGWITATWPDQFAYSMAELLLRHARTPRYTLPVPGGIATPTVKV
jgi:hypothetical protein